MKWQFAAASQSDKKYVCCNADEGDPGAFMDRSVLEGDPHVVLEAMTIAGYAIGAHQGYIYVRAEYPIAVKRLEIAIGQARENGLLGKNIFGTDFCFDVDASSWAPAPSSAARRPPCWSPSRATAASPGPVRPSPPSRACSAAHLAQQRRDLRQRDVDPQQRLGEVRRDGHREIERAPKCSPWAARSRTPAWWRSPWAPRCATIIYDIGGGCPNGKKFKAAQTGGPSGGCIPAT